MPKNEVELRLNRKPRVASSGYAAATVVYGGGGNADQVDGIDASPVPRPHHLLPLGADARFPPSVIPYPTGDALVGWGGRVIFGPHVTHLVEEIDAAQTTIYVREPNLEVDEYVILQRAVGGAEKMKITDGPTFEAHNRWAYTVSRNVDGAGALSFERGQAVVSLAKYDATTPRGYIAIDAQPTSYRPFVDVLERTGPNVNDVTIKARIGRLDGLTENNVDPDMQPNGYGIWTDNGYFRGTLRVRGDSRIEGALSVGVPGAPEVRISRRQLPNGHVVHGQQWFYQPGRVWWTQYFNETNSRVFWRVQKPAVGDTPEETLLQLSWRRGNPANGEPDVEGYFFDVNARAVIGELIAGRVRVSGVLSAMVGDFGEISTASLRIADQPFDSSSRNGFYAWRGSTFEQIGGASLGFEFWRNGVRQCYWDYDAGRLCFGEAGLASQLALDQRGISFWLTPSASYGLDVPAVYWRQADDAGYTGYVGRLFVHRTSAGGFEIGRAGWWEVFYDSDQATLPTSINLRAYGQYDGNHAGLSLYGNSDAPTVRLIGTSILFSRREGGLPFLERNENGVWRYAASETIDVKDGGFRPPFTPGVSFPGEGNATAATATVGGKACVVPVVYGYNGTTYAIGIDHESATKRLVVNIGGAWYAVNLTAV